MRTRAGRSWRKLADKLPIIFTIVVGGKGEKNASRGLVEMLLTMMVAEKSGTRTNGGLGAER